MFTPSEYLHHGLSLAKYCLLRSPVLPTVMLYVTDACNSRCRICHLWKIKKNTHLPLESIRGILRSPLVRQSNIGLEGGEFFLHPDYEAILESLSKRGRFTLLSNGLMPERLLRSTQRFRIPGVLISLDGGAETYRRVRGIDGYDRVRESILSARDYTDVSVVYTFGPWNTVYDFLEVQDFCRKSNVNLKINIFHNVPLFGIQEKLLPLDGVENLDVASPEKEYLRAYNGWLDGRVKAPCVSIRFRAVVWPDGSVPLCQGKDIILGNIHNQTMDEIWNSPKTKALWKKCYSCNDCWISFHRIYDVTLIKLLEKYLPGAVINKYLGEYTLDV